MEIEERLRVRELELKTYENKFNLLKNRSESENKTVLDPMINYLNDNYMLASNYNRIKNNNHMMNTILRHELENPSDITINNNNDLSKMVVYLFNRYNYLLKNITEDNWTIYKDKDNQFKYELKPNEFVLDNSISINNKNNPDLTLFLKKIHNIIKRIANMVNYSVHIKSYDDEYHMICWLIFVFRPL